MTEFSTEFPQNSCRKRVGGVPASALHQPTAVSPKSNPRAQSRRRRCPHSRSTAVRPSPDLCLILVRALTRRAPRPPRASPLEAPGPSLTGTGAGRRLMRRPAPRSCRRRRKLRSCFRCRFQSRIGWTSHRGRPLKAAGMVAVVVAAVDGALGCSCVDSCCGLVMVFFSVSLFAFKNIEQSL
ncbi:hypothetical protein BCR33DRAFT_434603 [Rhizoclosmatium globosum]|uniref:Uncharacterized protein n=1 Tax=Rhizoclosmatium globosum TaxID=329046 RepID=A0A1Y2BTY7_9FUNG|nr:hypothetical protein BCR33DRAFT_434603 [Rhizoclosmatium globosum]|eukprot:ORY38211.1 hypothetical protein BCR33DRAFT_434603 [Rhizoclosmatium globosum]